MVKGYEHVGFVSNDTGTDCILQYKYEELSRL